MTMTNEEITISATVQFTKKVEANSKEEAMTIFIRFLTHLQFGYDLIEFKEIDIKLGEIGNEWT